MLVSAATGSFLFDLLGFLACGLIVMFIYIAAITVDSTDARREQIKREAEKYATINTTGKTNN